ADAVPDRLARRQPAAVQRRCEGDHLLRRRDRQRAGGRELMRRGAIGGGISTVAAGAAILAMAAPAAAINTYNSQPAPERTEVGAFVALWDTDDDAVVDRLDWVCSGAMVDDDTFLTAAHCTDDWPAGTRFFVSLEQDIQTPLDDAVAAGLTASEAAAELLAADVIVEADAH